jgi:hypothetical protein
MQARSIVRTVASATPKTFSHKEAQKVTNDLAKSFVSFVLFSGGRTMMSYEALDFKVSTEIWCLRINSKKARRFFCAALADLLMLQ